MISDFTFELAVSEYIEVKAGETFDLVDMPSVGLGSSGLGRVEISVISPVLIESISSCGKSFKFKRPICVAVDHESGYWVHEYQPLKIYAYGETLSESRRAFDQDFAACWDGIANEPDEKLTLDAREMKNVMRELVVSF